MRPSFRALHQVKNAIRQKFAWPGGYQISVICNDGAALCPDCAKANFQKIARDTLTGCRTGWDAAGAEILWEGGNWCDQCGLTLDVYSDPEDGWEDDGRRDS